MGRRNTTFCGGEPTWANACVGDNGSPGYWDYAKGFSQAANLIIDNVLRGRGLNLPVDELIYPVCFNTRHSIELLLKGAISELISLESFRKRKLEYDLSGSHDIGNIWKFFSENSASIDERYISINRQLDTKVTDVSEIDSTGQTFRYPLNTESQKHLVDVAIISFVQLRKSFSELEEALDKLHRLNEYLYEEYSFCTFTNRLSRKNIFDVASKLPIRKQWSDASFDEVRASIKKQFNIGSKELSDSIKIIEKHYELAPIIGISIELLGVSELDIAQFIDLWFRLHDLSSDTEPVNVEVKAWCVEEMVSSITRSTEICNSVWEEIGAKLTPEMLAGFSALFYFARDLDFSERYILIYGNQLRGEQVIFDDSTDSLRKSFFHIFKKTNAIYNILRSLYFLKKNDIAEELVSTHSLDTKFSWLDAARNRVLFEKPEYCGYAI